VSETVVNRYGQFFRFESKTRGDFQQQQLQQLDHTQSAEPRRRKNFDRAGGSQLQFGIRISDLAETTGVLPKGRKWYDVAVPNGAAGIGAGGQRGGHHFRSPLRRTRLSAFVKAGEDLTVDRSGTQSGHQYHLLGYNDDQNSQLIVEPCMTTPASPACFRSSITRHGFPLDARAHLHAFEVSQNEGGSAVETIAEFDFKARSGVQGLRS